MYPCANRACPTKNQAAPMRCPCNKVSYCDKFCQKTDWQNHKAEHRNILESATPLPGKGAVLPTSGMPIASQAIALRPLDNQLFSMVQAGNLKQVKLLIQQGANVHSLNEKEGTVLFIAAEHGHFPVFEFLVNQGANVHFVHPIFKTTALYYAVHSRSMDILKILVKKKVDLNPIDHEGLTPLMRAAYHGLTRIVQYLHREGADINRTDSLGASPLLIAIQQKYLELVDYLAQHVSTEILNAVTSSNQSPVSLAIQSRALPILQTLCKRKDLNLGHALDLPHPLSFASYHGDVTIFQYLHQSGSAILNFTQEQACKTPLWLSLCYGHLPIIEYLFQFIDIRMADEYHSSIYIAAGHDHLSILKYLIEKGFDVNQANDEGATPLAIAVQYGYLEIVRYLLNHGAKIELSNNNLLWSAARHRHIAILQLLLPYYQSCANTSLMFISALNVATEMGYQDIIDILYEGWERIDTFHEKDVGDFEEDLISEILPLSPTSAMESIHPAALSQHLSILPFLPEIMHPAALLLGSKNLPSLPDSTILSASSPDTIPMIATQMPLSSEPLPMPISTLSAVGLQATPFSMKISQKEKSKKPSIRPSRKRPQAKDYTAQFKTYDSIVSLGIPGEDRIEAYPFYNDLVGEENKVQALFAFSPKLKDYFTDKELNKMRTAQCVRGKNAQGFKFLTAQEIAMIRTRNPSINQMCVGGVSIAQCKLKSLSKENKSVRVAAFYYPPQPNSINRSNLALYYICLILDHDKYTLLIPFR